MSVPTRGEEFAKLIEYLRKAQETSAMLSHLYRDDGNKTKALGWVTISEGLKQMQKACTMIATKGLN